MGNVTLLKNINPEIKHRFKVHCVEMGITMKEAIEMLMDLEVKEKILSKYGKVDRKAK